MSLKKKGIIDSYLTDDGIIEMLIPSLQGVAGIKLLVRKYDEKESQKTAPITASKYEETNHDMSLIDSMIIVYESYKRGNIRFQRDKKTECEDYILSLFKDVAQKIGGSVGAFEKVPFFIKSIFGGLAVVMRENNKKKSDDFIAEIKNGGGYSNSDPVRTFHSFLMKHGAGRSVRDNAGRAMFGQALMIVMDAWWYNEPLTLKSLEMKMQGAPKPMRFAPTATFQSLRGEHYTLMDMTKNKTA